VEVFQRYMVAVVGRNVGGVCKETDCLGSGGPQ
jgi:hypothetical protein